MYLENVIDMLMQLTDSLRTVYIYRTLWSLIVKSTSYVFVSFRPSVTLFCPDAYLSARPSGYGLRKVDQRRIVKSLVSYH